VCRIWCQRRCSGHWPAAVNKSAFPKAGLLVTGWQHRKTAKRGPGTGSRVASCDRASSTGNRDKELPLFDPIQYHSMQDVQRAQGTDFKRMEIPGQNHVARLSYPRRAARADDSSEEHGPQWCALLYTSADRDSRARRPYSESESEVRSPGIKQA
jgi:hypothetical protein